MALRDAAAVAAVFNYARFWKMVERAREKKGWTEEEAAKACGFSRATWYNYRNAKYSPTLEDLQGIAQAFEFTFRSPLTTKPMSGADRMTDEEPTGGLRLSDIAQQIVVILSTVPEEHHGFILDTVKNAAAIKGFQSPGAGSEGPAAARRNK